MRTRRQIIARGAGLAALFAGGWSRLTERASGAATVTAGDFRVPLESDRHARTFMQWPSQHAIYGGQRELGAVQQAIVRIAQTVARFEPVVMLASPEHTASATSALGADVSVWPIPTDDLWCRDAGPTFVVFADRKLAVSDLGFNGWGGKQQHARDKLVARRVADRLGLATFANGIVGEAGGVEVDGNGTAMAHESSWINPNRNRQSRAEIERLLLAALGATHMIWAPGIKGADITDYHIDALARFVKPGQVVIQLGARIDRSDPWSVAAFQTYEILKLARDARGRKLEIVVIPEPNHGRIRSASEDFVSSYVNYYVCNGGVIGAEFGDDTADLRAKSILEQLYPGRNVVSLDVDPIGEAGGGIHCATQQQPAV